jgi:hypothetical protein
MFLWFFLVLFLMEPVLAMDRSCAAAFRKMAPLLAGEPELVDDRFSTAPSSVKKGALQNFLREFSGQISLEFIGAQEKEYRSRLYAVYQGTANGYVVEVQYPFQNVGEYQKPVWTSMGTGLLRVTNQNEVTEYQTASIIFRADRPVTNQKNVNIWK